MKNLFLLLILITTVSVEAQITFQKTYGGIDDDFGFSVQQTTDGGYIITGLTGSFGAGNYDVFLIKTDVNGDPAWTKTYGGIDIELGSSVQQTTDGGYIIAGWTYSFGAGNSDVYLIRIDSNGDLLWTQTFGRSDYDEGYSVMQTSDGGFIITGRSSDFSSTDYDVYLIKTDPNGDSLWTKIFGGVGADYGYSGQQTIDGGYIITGISSHFSVTAGEVYLIKTDANGDSLWTKSYGGIDIDIGNSVQQTTDGGFIISGVTTSFGTTNNDAYIVRTDTNGDTLWTKTFNGPDDVNCTSIRQTSDGGYILTGVILRQGAGNDDAYLVKIDSAGNLIWTTSFGGPTDDYGHSVHQTTDGGYIIAGWTYSFGAGFADVYLIKTDVSGNSGCNMFNTITIISSPATQVANPTIIVTSPNTIVSNTSTIVNSGGIFNTLCTSVGINETSILNTFDISPNPTSNIFSVKCIGCNIISIEIYNLIGEHLNSCLAFSRGQWTVECPILSPGIYLVQVETEKGSSVQKLIVE